MIVQCPCISPAAQRNIPLNCTAQTVWLHALNTPLRKRGRCYYEEIDSKQRNATEFALPCYADVRSCSMIPVSG